MNLTLSIDPKLLKEARKVALEMDTSVNSLVRKYLQELVEDNSRQNELFLKEWEKLMEKNAVNMDDKNWTRDSLHER